MNAWKWECRRWESSGFRCSGQDWRVDDGRCRTMNGIWNSIFNSVLAANDHAIWFYLPSSIVRRQFVVASENGVWPSECLGFASTSSRMRSSFATAPRPFLAAHDNGVRPRRSLESASTSSRARSSFTTASRPFSAAIDRGDLPSLLFESAIAPFFN